MRGKSATLGGSSGRRRAVRTATGPPSAPTPSRRPDQIGRSNRRHRLRDRVTDLTNAIASSVLEQDAATREIAVNVSRAIDGSAIVTTSIKGVSGAVLDTTQASASVEQGSAKLAAVSDRLSETVAA